MEETKTIKCPNCKIQIDVNEILYHQLEDEIKQQNLQERQELEANYKKAMSNLKAQQSQLENDKEKFDEDVRKATKEQLKQENQKL